MKRGLNILITLCMLVCGIFFGVISGPQLVKLLAGSRPLEAGERFSQAEGSYIAYEAAYPVAEFVEKYYSGDPDREETMGYVVYDAERQAFICILVPYGSADDFRSLMRGLTLAAEMRAGRDMGPVIVEGSLEPMDDTVKQQTMAALINSEVVEMYVGILQDADDNSAYLGDQYGDVLEAMCRTMEYGLQLEKWYYIESGSINGTSRLEIWICVSAAGFSLLIFVFRLIMAFSGGREQALEPVPDSGSHVKTLIKAQRGWVEEWCKYSINRNNRFSYLTVVVSMAALAAVGFFAGSTLQGILVCHLPMGLLMGETVAVLSWFSQRKRNNPKKILERLEMSIQKQLPSTQAQEDFAQNLLDTGDEWVFQDNGKDVMLHGGVGEGYWAVFSSLGEVTIIHPRQLKRIAAETVSGQVRVGRVRTHYLYYTAEFFYHTEPKKSCDELLQFCSHSSRDELIFLIRKRMGDGIEITVR